MSIKLVIPNICLKTNIDIENVQFDYYNIYGCDSITADSDKIFYLYNSNLKLSKEGTIMEIRNYLVEFMERNKKILPNLDLNSSKIPYTSLQIYSNKLTKFSFIMLVEKTTYKIEQNISNLLYENRKLKYYSDKNCIISNDTILCDSRRIERFLMLKDKTPIMSFINDCNIIDLIFGKSGINTNFILSNNNIMQYISKVLVNNYDFGKNITLSNMYNIMKANYSNISCFSKSEIVNHDLVSLDMNKAYFYVMKKNVFPIGSPVWFDFEVDYNPNYLGYYYCKVTPVELPVKILIDQKNGCFSDKKIKGWFNSADLDLYRKHGFKIKIYNGYQWETSGKIYKEFCNDIEEVSELLTSKPLKKRLMHIAGILTRVDFITTKNSENKHINLTNNFQNSISRISFIHLNLFIISYLRNYLFDTFFLTDSGESFGFAMHTDAVYIKKSDLNVFNHLIHPRVIGKFKIEKKLKGPVSFKNPYKPESLCPNDFNITDIIF